MRASGRKMLLGAASLVALAFAGGTAFAGDILWWTPNWGEPRARELAAKFEAANPGIKVNLEITVSDGLPARIQTALVSGSPPDLIEAQHGWVAPYAQAGLVQPLDDVLQDKDDYIPAALDYDTWDGKLWGIPYRIETHGVIYNRGKFKDAGLDPDKPPQTWPELVDAAKKLTSGEQFGFAITGGGEFGNTVFRSVPFIWMNGGVDYFRGHDDCDGEFAGSGRGGEVLHRHARHASRFAALDAAERRHRQPPAFHRRDGRDVSVRTIRHRLDPQGER